MAKLITKDEVIEKLKDDGDFDRLRLQIIRRLKDNEGLRNNLMSVVKQSTALNRPNAQSMKPRQLSDAIFEEVGSQMMGQLSENLWGIIKSEDGMKNEIRKTVETVYNKLSNPVRIQEEEKVKSSSTRESLQRQKLDDGNIQTRINAGESLGLDIDNEPEEPPGFSLSSNHNRNGNQREDLIKKGEEERRVEMDEKKNLINEESDDDPEVPPGFG